MPLELSIETVVDGSVVLELALESASVGFAVVPVDPSAELVVPVVGPDVFAPVEPTTSVSTAPSPPSPPQPASNIPTNIHPVRMERA